VVGCQLPVVGTDLNFNLKKESPLLSGLSFLLTAAFLK
jgi:hypothetical protein